MVSLMQPMKQKSAWQRFTRTAVVVGLLTLITSGIVWTVYEFVVVNEGMQYFASRPRRLFHVLGIALAGTGLLVVFGRLSSRLRRGLGLVLLGSVAAGTSVFFGVFVHDLISLPAPLLQSGLREGLLFVVLAFLLAASLFWFEFVRLLRQKRDTDGESIHGV
jgi:hypothetical protein